MPRDSRKTRANLYLWDEDYEYLCAVALNQPSSPADVICQILREMRRQGIESVHELKERLAKSAGANSRAAGSPR